MRMRWEMIPAALALLLAAGLALTDTGVGELGTGWPGEDAAGGGAASDDGEGGGTSAGGGRHGAADLTRPFGLPKITAEELAAGLMAGEPGLAVIDIREGDAPPADLIPGAYWLPLSNEVWAATPGPFAETRKLVLVTDRHEDAVAAWQHVAAMGYGRAVVLDDGIAAWNDRYADPQEPAEDADADTWADYRERKAVALFLAGGVAALTDGAATGGAPRPVAPPPMPVRKVNSGPKAAEGC